MTPSTFIGSWSQAPRRWPSHQSGSGAARRDPLAALPGNRMQLAGGVHLTCARAVGLSFSCVLTTLASGPGPHASWPRLASVPRWVAHRGASPAPPRSPCLTERAAQHPPPTSPSHHRLLFQLSVGLWTSGPLLHGSQLRSSSLGRRRSVSPCCAWTPGRQDRTRVCSRSIRMQPRTRPAERAQQTLAGWAQKRISQGLGSSCPHAALPLAPALAHLGGALLHEQHLCAGEAR